MRTIEAADVWTILDFNRQQFSASFLHGIQKFKAHYTDTSNHIPKENIYKACITSMYAECEIDAAFPNPKDIEMLHNIEHTCQLDDAFYFRIID